MRAVHSITPSRSSDLPREPPARPVAAPDHDAVEGATERFNAHDLDGLEDLLADDVICRAPGGVEEQGRAACIEFHRRWLADFPDAQVEVRARHTIDRVVVEEGTFRGTHDGVAPTGRSVCFDFVRVVEVRDGKQVSLDLTFDRLVMLEQLGLV
jgi:ketosteroid isomerase-like protein